MNSKYMILKEIEGEYFSKLSGDDNKIHIDNLTGYNSIFGEKICHASLILIKFFRKIKIKQFLDGNNQFSINVKFYKHFCYNQKILIKLKKKRKSNIYELYQFNTLRAIIEVERQNNLLNYNLHKIKKKFIKKNSLIKFYNTKNNMGITSMLLCLLTKYVGKIYPGENSLINEININFNNKFNFNKKYVQIYSKKQDRRFPIILNKLTFQFYCIEFKTSQRPKLEIKLNKIKNHIKKYVKKINSNILIIGGSTGIGFDVLNIFKQNKKIKIFATYNKNKIDVYDKNIFKINVNLEKNIFKIKEIIKNNSPLYIYYFATPKIDLNLKNQKLEKIYEKFYINYPLKILSFCKHKKINFFYPSTIFINQQRKSIYSKVKKIGENKLKKLSFGKLKINICRIEEVNTKQNLSLINRGLPNFRDILDKNENYKKNFFFIN